MTTSGPGQHPRRRRRRASAPQGSPSGTPGTTQGATGTSGAPAPTPAPTAAEETKAAPRRRPRRDHGEHGLRDLVGAGPSQLGVSGALRARDVNQPDEADLAQAEAETTIVRRNWRPPGGTA